MRYFIRSWSCVRILFGLAIPLCLLWSGTTLPVTAQSDAIAWSKPINLSNTPQGSGNPAIVADGYGNVHVFWSEDMGGAAMRVQDPLPEGNSIFYKRWDGENWTSPIDILSVPDDAIANFISVACDAQNQLHAVWTGQSNLYYSYAPAEQAYSARAWTIPVILAPNSARSAWMISIAAGATGELHVAYATRGSQAGVYYIHAAGAGKEWDAPIKLSGAMDALEESISNVKLAADGAGRLHVAWQTSQIEGFGQAVYYARSPDNGRHWSSPTQMGYRRSGDFDVGLSSLVAQGKSEVHLIYNAGTSPVGRYERVSQDGGETWSSPYLIFAEMEGLNGFLTPLVDGAGQMHMIIDMRTRDTLVVGIYYARWLDPGWTKVLPVATAAPYGPSAHYTAATVRLGNELHVVWTQLRFGEIWYTHGTVPGVAPAAAAPPRPETLASSQPVTATVTSPRLVLTARPTLAFTDLASPAAAETTDNPLLYSVGVPFLLVLCLAAAAALVLARRRR
jgi:hypothetical protein